MPPALLLPLTIILSVRSLLCSYMTLKIIFPAWRRMSLEFWRGLCWIYGLLLVARPFPRYQFCWSMSTEGLPISSVIFIFYVFFFGVLSFHCRDLLPPWLDLFLGIFFTLFSSCYRYMFSSYESFLLKFFCLLNVEWCLHSQDFEQYE